MKKLQQGFTLVEIMIVVAIIGLLAAIAIPNFMKSRETTRMNACISNLKQIDSAKEQWAIAENEAEGADCEADNIKDYIKGNAVPKCPANKEDYDINPIGTDPECGYDSTDYPHKLPEVD